MVKTDAQWRPDAGFVQALLAVLCMSGCADEGGSPEAEIRAWVEQGTRFAEAEARRDLLGMISPAYADARGNNRDDLNDLFRLYFLRADNIKLVSRIEEIILHGSSAADVVVTVGMAGTSSGMPGFTADAYRFEMELERSDRWRLIGARWGAFGDDLH